MEEKFQQLEDACKKFDWTYPFSDDSRAWRDGQAKQEKLQKLITECETLDKDRTRMIVLTYQGDAGITFYRREPTPEEGAGVMGRKGGKSTSPAKRRAAAKNLEGNRPGWPKGKPRVNYFGVFVGGVLKGVYRSRTGAASDFSDTPQQFIRIVRGLKAIAKATGNTLSPDDIRNQCKSV